jgi:hypothetical protein
MNTTSIGKAENDAQRYRQNAADIKDSSRGFVPISLGLLLTPPK